MSNGNKYSIDSNEGEHNILPNLLGHLYDFAGRTRTVNLSKGGFSFPPAAFLNKSLDLFQKEVLDNVKNQYDTIEEVIEDIAKVHGYIRKRLMALLGDEAGAKVRILYGGSVKPSNAKELMAINNVNGALVGGASLKAKDFLGIIAAYQNTG